MKKLIIEPDFIGGQGSLTKEEEIALSQYFSARKNKKSKQAYLTPKKSKSNRKIHA